MFVKEGWFMDKLDIILNELKSLRSDVNGLRGGMDKLSKQFESYRSKTEEDVYLLKQKQ